MFNPSKYLLHNEILIELVLGTRFLGPYGPESRL